MPSLALRLAAPLQSWGAAEGGTFHKTSDVPTKSGVFGLLSNAAGFERSDGPGAWRGMSMFVRVDSAGALVSDYHSSVRRNKDGSRKGDATLSNRTYLANAAFLVVLNGNVDVIQQAHAALMSPARTLYLGRRSCVPSVPIVSKNSVIEGDPLEVIKTFPWIPFTAALTGTALQNLTARFSNKSELTLATVSDTLTGQEPTAYVRDIPVCLLPDAREFSTRPVTLSTVTIDNPVRAAVDTNTHDPLEGIA